MRKETVISLAVVFGCAACGSVKNANPDSTTNTVDSGGNHADAPPSAPDAARPMPADAPPADAASTDANAGIDAAMMSPDANTGDFSLALAQTQLTIPYESSATDSAAIARVGSPGSITLTAKAPKGISVKFSPNPIASSKTTTTLTVSVAPGAAKGSNSVTITGTSQTGVSHSAKLTVAVQTITITGTVRGKESGITVVMVGKSAVTSDGNGNFTFTNVAPPYDIYTSATSASLLGSGTPMIFYYKGLTRKDPTINAANTSSFFLPRFQSATVNGTLSGSGDAVNPAAVVWGTGGNKTITGTRSYSLTASWINTSTVSGNLFGLQWTTNSSNEPNGYLGFGQTGATLTNGGTSTVNIVMSGVSSTATLSGMISAPVGYSPPKFTLSQQLGNNQTTLWTGSVSVISAKIPLISAGKSSLFATATQGTGSAQAVSNVVFPALNASKDVTFSMPPASVQTAPANSATGVTTSTVFKWTPPSNTISEVAITGSVDYFIITRGSQTTIPNVPEQPLPSATSLSWKVNNFGSMGTTDQAASATGFIPANGPDFGGKFRFSENSATRTFTSN